MQPQRPTLEVMATTVDEAIRNGLSDLGLTENDVEIEVLDEGSRGLFGLGSRLARVRLTVKTGQEKAPQQPPRLPARERIPAVFPIAPPAKPAVPPKKEAPKPKATDISQAALAEAQDVIENLLEKMGITASVSARFGEADEDQKRLPVLINIQGNDLGILIGKKAETLNALQYVASLILNKRLGHSTTLVVDVQGYRERRQQQIRQLARRMADQAVKTGRKQVLEPMSASERRIVHMELRNYAGVRTESIGEEPHRKVTIIPTQP